MAAVPTTADTQPSNEEIFQAIDAYPWDDDAEFQAGLAAILGTNTDPAQVGRLTLRARCFYYSRKHPSIQIDFPAYQSWHLSHQSSDSNNVSSAPHPTESQMRPTEATVESVLTTSDEPPPYPMTFTQIVELISTGAPIPGIKDIPDTLLEGQSTASTRTSRKKPWEKDESDAEATGGIEATGEDSRQTVA